MNQLLIQEKSLMGEPKGPCLIINLGDGVVVQHRIRNHLEAALLYSHYSSLNPHIQPLPDEEILMTKALFHKQISTEH